MGSRNGFVRRALVATCLFSMIVYMAAPSFARAARATARAKPRAQASSDGAVERAAAAVAAAEAAVKVVVGRPAAQKRAEQNLEQAYANYNTALNNRLAYAQSRVKELEVLIKQADPHAQLDGPNAATSGNPLIAEYAALTAESAQIEAKLGRGAGGTPTPTITPEAEPNNTSATATALNLAAQPCAIAMGSLTIGDVDFYTFTAPAGSKAWISTDTGGAQNGGATSRDTVMDLIAPDGTTVIENDDDDGNGNGCDGTSETALASIIGGRTLVAGGTYFIRVIEFNQDALLDPYKLFVVVTNTAATPEVEANNTSATANALVTTPGGTGLASGALTAGDADFYSVSAEAGNIIFWDVDTDPERDGGVDIVAALIGTDGVTVLFSADSSISSVGAAEGACFAVPATGTYFVRVTHFSASGTGTYNVMASSCSGATGGGGGGCDIVCPPDQNVTATSEAGAVVNYPAPTVSGNCTSTITCVPASGSTFPVGTTSVTCTSTGDSDRGGTPAPTITPEAEPNNTSATATALNLAAQPCAIAMGSLTIGDVDFYTFTAPAGSKAWISTDTGGAQNGGATSRDTVMDLIAPDGTTVIENDDDDGNGNGCDGTSETALASIIGGRTLVAGGTYFIRVIEFNQDALLDPYKLFVVVTNTAATPEVEANNTSATANALVTTPGGTGLASGALTAGDADFYSVSAEAGNIIFWDVDTDPERDGGVDIVAALIGTDGVTVLFSADSSISSVGAAEGACFAVPATGTYFVRVTHFSASGTGTYNVMASSCSGATGGGGGGTSECSFNVTVGIPFDGCCVDDFSGDTFQQVVGTVPTTSPLYGFWQYTVAATGEVFTGNANFVAYRPGASIVMRDTDSATVAMQAQIDFARKTCLVQVTDRSTNRTFTLRDRNITNSTCGAPPPPPTRNN